MSWLANSCLQTEQIYLFSTQPQYCAKALKTLAHHTFLYIFGEDGEISAIIFVQTYTEIQSISQKEFV